jgi:hypothetical protein
MKLIITAIVQAMMSVIEVEEEIEITDKYGSVVKDWLIKTIL